MLSRISDRFHFLRFTFQSRIKPLPQFKNPCWYDEKEFRCFPYFFIIGASKTGTSDLYQRVQQHPQYVTPMSKEPNWFSQKIFSKCYCASVSCRRRHLMNTPYKLLMGLLYFHIILDNGTCFDIPVSKPPRSYLKLVSYKSYAFLIIYSCTVTK